MTTSVDRPATAHHHGEARRRPTGAMDAVVVASGLAVVAFSAGLDLPARRWIALGFVVVGPGWAVQRRLRARLGAQEAFLAVGISLAVVAVTGHLAVTVFDWHWAPLTAALGVATAAATAGAMWRDGLLRGQERPALGPYADPETEPDPRPTRPGTDRSLVLLAAGLISAVVAVVALRGADETSVSALGLLPVVPGAGWIGLAILAAACVLAIDDTRRGVVVFAVLLAALILVLHGMPGWIEQHPRFPVAWLHTGFVDQISTGGELRQDLDARFSWPGFFAGAALLDRLAGTEGTVWLLRFAPVGANLVFCLGLWALGRTLGLPRVVRATAAVLFVVTNWSGQDYFSPQAVAIVLYLTILVLVLDRFPAPGPDPDSRLGRILARYAVPERDSIPADAPRSTGAVLGIAALCGVLVITHQLTPGFLTAVLLLLGLTRLSSLRWMGVVVALMTVGWLSYGGEAWWLGHLDTLLGPIGRVGEIVGDNVGERTAGAVAERELVIRARALVAVAVWVAGAFALIRAWRHGPTRTQLVLAVLFVAPFPLVVVQPYGGELLIRIYLATLPAVCLLIAQALVGRRIGRLTPGRQRALAALVVAILPVFVVARLGNEAYERVAPGDLRAADSLMATAPDGSVAYVANAQTLQRHQRVGDIRVFDLRSLDPDRIVAQLEAVADGVPGGVFVYFTASQEAYEEQASSLPDGWLEDLIEDLVETDSFEVHHREGAGAVLELRP